MCMGTGEDSLGRSASLSRGDSQAPPGDVILRYARKAIRAMGLVETPPVRETPVPGEREQGGFRVGLPYLEFDEPIQLDDIPLDWRLEAGGSVFDRNGDVKQGHLYRGPRT